ncbi:MAG: efflux RND transporter permease subunit, partial [Aggregatilineales bacterium]
MKSFFSVITRTALRFRAITLAIAALVISGGIIAGLELKQELIPPVELPQTFIIAQAAGLSSEEVLTVVTSRLETEIMAIPEIVNVDSQTSGTFGAFIIASNDFGLDQQKLQRDILGAIDNVWFPSRSISPADDQDAQLFAASLMA